MLVHSTAMLDQIKMLSYNNINKWLDEMYLLTGRHVNN